MSNTLAKCWPRLCEVLHSIFFFTDTATTEIYTLSLHDALPICMLDVEVAANAVYGWAAERVVERRRSEEHTSELQSPCKLVCRLLLEKTKASAPGAAEPVVQRDQIHHRWGAHHPQRAARGRSRASCRERQRHRDRPG